MIFIRWVWSIGFRVNVEFVMRNMFMKSFMGLCLVNLSMMNEVVNVLKLISNE